MLGRPPPRGQSQPPGGVSANGLRVPPVAQYTLSMARVLLIAFLAAILGCSKDSDSSDGDD